MKFSFSILLLLLNVPGVHGDCVVEIAAIRQTAIDYMEVWYLGDDKRMKASLHKELAKRSLKGIWGEDELRHTTASDMVSYTKSRYGERLWQQDLNINVEIMDCFKDIASVKVMTPHYYEYLHLAKMEDKWVIINALYEKNSPVNRK